MNAQNTTSPPLKIMIAEDHEWARVGLRFSIQSKSALEVVAEAENGEHALDLAKQLQPDIVLMDIGMPVMDGIAATRQIKAQLPNTRVVMLTSHQDENEVFASLAAGADAYCMKDISIERLVAVIQMVAEGGIWLDAPIAQMVINAIPDTASEAGTGKGLQRRRIAELTDREMDVLNLIAQGQSNKEIAETLAITTHTVKVHVGNIIQKLAVEDRTQAAIKALQDGLIGNDRAS